MNVANFSESQRQALLELLVLGMYADGHLASVEDAKIQEVAATLDFASAYQQQQFLDDLFTRLSQIPLQSDAMRAHLAKLAKNFPTHELRHQALRAVGELLASDSNISPQESKFSALLRAEFGI